MCRSRNYAVKGKVDGEWKGPHTREPARKNLRQEGKEAWLKTRKGKQYVRKTQ